MNEESSMKNRHVGQLLLSLPIRVLRRQLKHLEAVRTRIEVPAEPTPARSARAVGFGTREDVEK